LRAKAPQAPRPFKALGYPMVPAVFVVASLAIVLNAIYTSPGPSGAGALVIAAGIPVYLLFRRRATGAGEGT